MNPLDAILAATRKRVGALKTRGIVYEAARAEPARGARFHAALKRDSLAVIAEIKRRSPSAGLLADIPDPAAQARAYIDGGAAAISIVTEPDFFGGSLEDLRAVAALPDAPPILMKDFVLDLTQLDLAVTAGASAVLLLAGVLDDRLPLMIDAARHAGLAAVVEAHTAEEIRMALRARTDILGVNQRNLRSFAVDRDTAARLIDRIPEGLLRIAESGVRHAADARRLRAAGYDAILVGEALLRHPRPAELLHNLRTGDCHAAVPAAR